MSNFESFRRSLVPLKADPLITVQKRGMLSLNRSAFAALGSPECVELLYDREHTVMGLRAVDPKADNAYTVRRATSSPSGPWVISAMAFTKFYDIDTTRSLRWAAYLEGEVLCADLSVPGVPVTSNRERRQ